MYNTFAFYFVRTGEQPFFSLVHTNICSPQKSAGNVSKIIMLFFPANDQPTAEEFSEYSLSSEFCELSDNSDNLFSPEMPDFTALKH